MNISDETKRVILHIALFVLMLIPIIKAMIDIEYYGTRISVQLTIMQIGTLISIGFIFLRMFNIIDINSVKSSVAKMLFPSISNLLFAMYAGFGIAFSILWGSLYTYAVSEENMALYKITLKMQGLNLLFFLVCVTIVIIVSVLHPLTKRIE